MTTLKQIQQGEEIWSLEEDAGALYLHYVSDGYVKRMVMPVTSAVLAAVAEARRKMSEKFILPEARDPELESELVNIIRQHVNERSIDPEDTAQTLLVVAYDILECMEDIPMPLCVLEARALILHAIEKLEP